MRSLAIVLGSSLAFAVVAHTQQPRAVLLELFTSEGCSSCPPADALLRQLNQTRSQDGTLLIALSEHVTYWNSLGWHDPFSTAAATSRQDAYSRRFHQNEVYTPQMIVNGEAQVLGSDPVAIAHAVAATHRGASASLHLDAAKRSSDTLAVTFTLTGASRPLAIFAAITEDSVSSIVPRGENGGRTLTHIAVATTLAQVATTANVNRMTIQLPVSPWPGAGPAPSRHLILYAQDVNLGPIQSIDTAPL